ncbi:DUF1826 domain-containing protein [Vibrio gazogenes]|uniref:Succinylglutamate desuccinylase n=1 Tax=Vibrio gazogenes DSM 21264 = NBRC 103151 TaxID=1123492 RepID=A0A1M5HF43_VIBGA|nr:DUF1826 domain-containing protein [Vibrio gazogenes]USP13597.1 DUF1826 domain-containing protein [Vibrio gazogenes]SHG14560.1 Protein of unknown function [Vibrio gazogenes DSM 21264] [Vibrio gazogenes DSM 21264 = NBRC 103151]SJN55624.1 hypothetical protein BQ6471_01636 [Vibrio gazogenes]
MSVDMAMPAEMVRGASVAPRSTMPSILSDIYQPENNIAIWQRPLSSEMTAHIKNMLQEGQPLALVQSVTPANAAEWIRNRLSDYECADALGEDIGLIVDMFCCLFDLQQVGLRLTALDKPMCPKFHVDQIPCRLVTTYVGSATEWLSNDDVDRRKLGAGAQGMADHLSGLFDNEQRINQMQSGDVALLKGGGWEGNEQTGLVHRSPELISNERRLLLTLDFI